jgi:hypothetical protein
MKRESFILTLTVNSKPVILHFTGGPDTYEVSARNDREISPFSISREGNVWSLHPDAPAAIRNLENELSVMIKGCTEVQEPG